MSVVAIVASSRRGVIMAERETLSLDKLDPAREWSPWEPTAKDPWNLKWAGHLYRRAGFGASIRNLRMAVDQGLEATIKNLLSGTTGADSRGLEKILHDTANAAQQPDAVQQYGAGELQGWWVKSILAEETSPLREKMTLFWHNHFATSIAKVQRPFAMLNQNKTQRYYALSKFGPLLMSMSKDGAMLTYLDSNSNVKGAPNENYAREVMELFSLGVGNYTEKDIQEAARAFTGWHVDGDDYTFKDQLHDFGPKKVLGKEGDLNGGDVVKVLLEQPACARFIVRKLYRNFVSETTEPPDALLEPLAERYRKGNYDSGDLMKTILTSKHFFSDYAYRQRIKAPVEFVFGVVNAMRFGSFMPPEKPLVGIMEAMGQTLFAPPNVKGWPGGRAWLNTSTVLARANFSQRAAAAQWPENTYNGSALLNPEAITNPDGSPIDSDDPPEGVCDVAQFIRKEKCKNAEETVDRLIDLLLQGSVRPEARAKVVEFMTEAKTDFASHDARVRASAHAIMTLPEYQLA
jgi:uncharacterized protein (DUF1800 family)